MKHLIGTGNDATNGDDMFADLTDNGKDIIDLLDTDDEDQIIKKENPIYVYACDMCSFETPDSNDLEKHIDIPHTFVCIRTILSFVNFVFFKPTTRYP